MLQMNFELRRLAGKKGPDEEDLTKMASTLDEFIFRLFDPLRSGGRIRDVFLKSAINDVLEAAIEFEQKNVSYPKRESQFSLRLFLGRISSGICLIVLQSKSIV